MKKVDEHTAKVTHSSRYRVVWIDRRIDGKFVRSIGPTCLLRGGLSRSRIRYSRFTIIVVTIPREHREFSQACDVENIYR